MNKAVIISINPKWVDLILSGHKTLELRKNKPKLDVPFKVYIYCTNWKGNLPRWKDRLGKVVAEFTCNWIYPFRVFEEGTIQNYNYNHLSDSCVPYEDIVEYVGKSKKGYAWHISNLKVYDTPKNLNFFTVKGDCDDSDGYCDICPYLLRGSGGFFSYFSEDTCECSDGYKPIKWPPQSWQYVEEINV